MRNLAFYFWVYKPLNNFAILKKLCIFAANKTFNSYWTSEKYHIWR